MDRMRHAEQSAGRYGAPALMLALALAGAVATREGAAQTAADSLAAVAADSIGTAAADTLAGAIVDSLRAPVPVRPPAPPVPPREPAARFPRERAPWARLPALGDTLWIRRETGERTGAHPPPDLLGLIAGAAETEAGGGAPFGALGYGGSFAIPEVTASGRPLRLPRLEGIDLSEIALDRLGPGLDLLPMGSAGDVAVTERQDLGPGSLAVLTHPAETPGDSATSRFAGSTGEAGVTVAALFFADRRGPFSYSVNVENGSSDHTGALSSMRTRLSIIDFGVRTGFGRLALQLHNMESDATFLNGNDPHHFDQGITGAIVGGDSLGPAWRLQIHGFDDRLSGSEFPGVELKRKEMALQADLYRRPGRPYWAGIEGEHDWFTIRHPTGKLTPGVSRARATAGLRMGIGRAIVQVTGTGLASDRHPLRAGGTGELSLPIPGHFVLGLGGGRGHVSPTFDQEVLVPGSPVATPERHDQMTIRLTRQGRVAASFLAARRNLVDVPLADSVSHVNPWPEFAFDTVESRHWEIGGTAESPLPWGFLGGIAASHWIELDNHGERLPFFPSGVAQAHLSYRRVLFGGDFVFIPRVDVGWMGERRDFAGRTIVDHARLDVLVGAVVGQDFDLELRIRNITSEHYGLAVNDPVSGRLYTDPGRIAVFSLRWRFLN
jgi:hypothetical protein